jgi:hypothetical protein
VLGTRVAAACSGFYGGRLWVWELRSAGETEEGRGWGCGDGGKDSLSGKEEEAQGRFGDWMMRLLGLDLCLCALLFVLCNLCIAAAAAAAALGSSRRAAALLNREGAGRRPELVHKPMMLPISRITCGASESIAQCRLLVDLR